MKSRVLIISFLLLLTCIEALCIPARRTVVYLTQPDGSVFQAYIKGDEFMKIKTTASGHSIIQDKDGWWYYASYEDDGSRSSAGWKVGAETPAYVLAESSRIPYHLLSAKAAARRKMIPYEEEAILKRMRKAPETKDGTEMKHGLVILANFSDVRFKYTKEDFERMLTEEGYSINGATGSAKKYFDDQFQGLIEFDFHVTDIVTLPKNRAHYGGNDSVGDDKAPAEMIRDACRLVDDDVDFSIYDDDNDGEADNVFLFFAGHDEAEGGSDECIWSHSWYIYRGAHIDLVLDETRIDRYACSSELFLAHDQYGNTYEAITGIGTFCHEYSHTLGLPDFYDTDYEESGGISAGMWTSTSLMDGGNYNNMGNTPPNYNALERMIAGIIEPERLTQTGTYRLAPINEDGRSYMFSTKGTDEFFIFECRGNKGWDSHIGGSGMLIYHVNLSGSSFKEWLSYNEVNINPQDQKADLIEADGRADRFDTIDEFNAHKMDLTGIFFPYHDISAMESEDFSIGAIRKEDGNIKFNFITENGGQVPPSAVNIIKDVYADAAIIGFESSYTSSGDATVAWGRTGKDKDTLTVKPYEPGKYAFVIEGLESAGKTYDIDIVFIKDGMEGETVTTSIMTKRMPSVKWPYIYLGNTKRNEDGTFPPESKLPLRIYGASEAVEIGWTFNGMPVTSGGDGYYTLKSDGILTAIILWKDGTTDKISKEIRIQEEIVR